MKYKISETNNKQVMWWNGKKYLVKETCDTQEAAAELELELNEKKDKGKGK